MSSEDRQFTAAALTELHERMRFESEAWAIEYRDASPAKRRRMEAERRAVFGEREEEA